MIGAPRAVKITGPLLDVLAIIAYRQPVTRNEIDSLRGYESAGLVRQLVRLGLIKVEKPLPGNTAATFGTTQRFLELFALTSLDDLPKTADLQKL
jgi:segregation and condensation protein B